MIWVIAVLLLIVGGLFYWLADTKVKFYKQKSEFDALKNQVESEKSMLETAMQLSLRTGMSIGDATEAIIRVKQQTFQTKQRRARMKR